MIQLSEEFDSVFRYIVVVSQRAEQLINGAKPRSESRHAKPTLVAKTDVDTGEDALVAAPPTASPPQHINVENTKRDSNWMSINQASLCR